MERAAHDPKVVVTTYEGQHNHTIPPTRTVVEHSTDGLNASSSGHNEDINMKSNNIESVHGDIVAEASTTSQRNVNGGSNGKSKKRASISQLVGFNMSVLPGPESKSDEQSNSLSSGKLGENDDVCHGSCADVKDEHSRGKQHTNNAAAVRS